MVYRLGADGQGKLQLKLQGAVLEPRCGRRLVMSVGKQKCQPKPAMGKLAGNGVGAGDGVGRKNRNDTLLLAMEKKNINEREP